VAPGPSNSQPTAKSKNAFSMKLMNFIMLAVTLFWAANAVAGKFALRGFNPLALAQLRVAGTALGFLAIYFAWHGWPRQLSRRDWIFMGIGGLTGVTLNQLTYIDGLSRTSVAHTAWIIALGPILVLALAILMRMEALTAEKAWGMAIAFCGVGVLTIGRPPAGTGANWVGDLILLAGRLAFACFTILLKKGSDHYDSLTLNTLTFTAGAVLMIPFSFTALVHVHWRAIPAYAWEALAFMIFFGTLLAYLLYAFALTVMTASQAISFVYLSPLMTIGLGVWLLTETLTWKVGVAGALILLGLYFTGQGDAESLGATEQ
jgi:drug/metabolite transporter (DMT)-like permease